MAYDWNKAAKEHTMIAEIATRAREFGIGPNRYEVGAVLATAHFCGCPMDLREMWGEKSNRVFAERLLYFANLVLHDMAQGGGLFK